MRILVWGLGYVGTVSAVCLARLGHEVIGIDPNLAKIEAINDGRSAIKEPGLQDLVDQAVLHHHHAVCQDDRLRNAVGYEHNGLLVRIPYS